MVVPSLWPPQLQQLQRESLLCIQGAYHCASHSQTKNHNCSIAFASHLF